MKRTLLSSLILIFVLAGCNEKENRLNQKIDEQSTQIDELTEKNSVLKKENEEYQDKISELEAKLEQSEKRLADLKMSKFDFSDVSVYETHKIDYDLKFEYNGYDTKIFENPDENQNVIYTIQKNDEIKVSQFVTLKETGETYIKAGLMPDLDIVGFIKISRNPYKDGNFEYKETIIVDDKDVKVLNFNADYEIFNNSKLRKLPSESSEVIYQIKYENYEQIYYPLDEITSDYGWVRATVDGNTGWVEKKCLTVERGGPIVYTPEAVVYFDLVGSHEI